MRLPTCQDGVENRDKVYSNRWLAVISSNLTDTDVIVVSLEDSGKTFVYVFFLFDSQECPSGRVFTRGSTIVFAPCIHANKW